METKQRLGDMLVSQGIISESDLIKALEYQKIHRLRLGEVLVEWNLITEDDLLSMLSVQLGIQYIRDSDEISVTKKDVKEVISQTPLHILKFNQYIPIGYDKSKNLLVLCNDINNANIEQQCRKIYKAEPVYMLAKNAVILSLLSEYERDKDREESLSRIKGGITATVHIYDLNAKDESPTVTEVNYILLNAHRKRASDIHFVQEETLAYLQYRIDGILQLIETYPVQKSGPLISRMKNMSGVSSTEKRRAQDGSFQTIADGDTLDMRLSTRPTIYGEKLVIRLLDRKFIETLSIDGLGFSDYNKERYLSLLNNPNGILVITGPTGSGKTSTIYTSLKHLSTGERSIDSIEDPVEYKISGVTSTQINEKAGVTFNTGMRTLVRQDPDIIFVGEIRDGETAKMAVDASNTGHFIITTLHTNDSVSAVSRLLDLGVKPYQLIDAFMGATAQVLVRKTCFNCGGSGCEKCDNTGYYGRIPLQEVFIFSPAMKELILQADKLYRLREVAIAEGLIPMLDDGMEKVQQGLTTMEEVMRVAKRNTVT